MKIAVIGCAHGELDKIYETVVFIENENKIKVDLVLCCGDFQSTRNADDLECMAIPPKYRSMCSFHKYYSGEKLAPVLTIFIGGNHEASNYLQELPFGGWVAPNIYYLGYAGVVEIGGVRIAGSSGIFKPVDYYKGHFEAPPYNNDTLRSCYHTRNIDVFRLKQLSRPVDIMISHDWPLGVYNHGDLAGLLKEKPFFTQQVEENELGSWPFEEILNEVRPSYWFSAHLHVKFAAVVKHNEKSTTKFLSLDKCLPRRKFLQVVEVPHEGDLQLKYDLEWLAILQLTNHLNAITRYKTYLPGRGSEERWKFTPLESEKEAVFKKMNENLIIPENFVRTAPVYSANNKTRFQDVKPNPQTTELCQRLGIDDIFALVLDKSELSNSVGNNSQLEFSSFMDSSETEPAAPANIRTPMKLPAPQFSEELAPLVPPPTSSPAIANNSQNTSEASPPDDNELNSNPTQPKQFKRRNVAIYSLTSGES